MRVHRLLLVFTSVLVMGCEGARAPWQNAGNRAPDAMTASFALKAAAFGGGPPGLVLRADALEKEFLLRTSVITQEDAPVFSARRSRIVFFRRVASKILMIEASRGLLLTRDYPQTLPLAEFPILGEEDGNFSVDFNAGMTRVALAGDWRPHEINSAWGGESAWYKIALGYVSRAEMADDQTLEIHQVALAEATLGPGVYEIPLETVFYLSPYRPNPNFKPTPAPPTLDHLGFMEVKARWTEGGGSEAFAAKLDRSRLNLYAISANTPARYRDAIRDGVRYWNKAFGRKVVDVIDAPADRSDPGPLFNIIRWVDHETGDLAFADAQADPRTGEILNHQIYLPSLWGRYARREIHRAGAGVDFARRFGATHACDGPVHAATDEFSTAIHRAAETGNVEKVINDLIRAVVAHEVGHTLGLRHNFAGSLAANYDVDRRDALFQAYLTTGEAPNDLVVTSSVMDYVPAIEAFLLGDQIARGTVAAEYDVRAVRALYDDPAPPAVHPPLFCTDSQINAYADCAPGDAGSSFVAWVRHDGRRRFAQIPRQVLETFERAKSPELGEAPRALGEVSLDGRALAASVFDGSVRLAHVLRGDLRLLAVERQFPNHGPAFSDEIEKKVAERMQAEIQTQGGFDEILFKTHPRVIEALDRAFERLTQPPAGSRLTETQHIDLTTPETTLVRGIARRVFEDLHLQLGRAEVSALAGRASRSPRRFPFNEVTREFARFLARRTAFFAFATAGEGKVFRRRTAWTEESLKPTGPGELDQTVKVPEFTYPFDLRARATEILRADRADSPAWGYGERRGLGQLFARAFSEALPGLDPAAGDALDGYPSEVVRFALELREIAGLFELAAGRSPK